MDMTVNRLAARMVLAGRTPKVITPAEFAEQHGISIESATAHFNDASFPAYRIGRNFAAVDILVDIWLLENPRGRRLTTRNTR